MYLYNAKSKEMLKTKQRPTWWVYNKGNQGQLKEFPVVKMKPFEKQNK